MGGDLPATNVIVQNAGDLMRPGDVPAGETLAPGESTHFLMTDSMGKPLSSQLWVLWDGENESAALPAPPVE